MPDISYRRNLPHIHPEGFPLFITFRLADSLPAEILHKLKAERDRDMKSVSNRSRAKIYEVEQKHFNRYHEWLDRCATGPLWLREEIGNLLMSTQSSVSDTSDINVALP